MTRRKPVWAQLTPMPAPALMSLVQDHEAAGVERKCLRYTRRIADLFYD